MSSGDEEIDQLRRNDSDSDESDFGIPRRRAEKPKARPKVKQEGAKRVKEAKANYEEDSPRAPNSRAKMEAKAARRSPKPEEEDDDDTPGSYNGRKESNDFDEEEEDSRREQKHRRRLRRHAGRTERIKDFVDSAASEEEEEYDGLNLPEARQNREEVANMYRRKEGPSGILRADVDMMDPEAVNKHYEELEIEEKEREVYETIGSELPTPSDPKLFAVRCKSGLEKEAVVSLLRKAYDLQGKYGGIPIFSASAIDKIPGTVFVEAYQEKAVRDLCEGLIALNKELIKIIPITQVRDVFRPDPTKNIKLEANKFVRVKSGVYAGDLGLVENVDIGRSAAIVKLIPRLLAHSENDGRHGGPIDGAGPQKKLWNKDDYPHNEVILVENKNINKLVYKYRNEYFENGFVKKRFGVNNLITEGVRPSYEELNIFKKAEPNDKVWDEMMKQLTLINDPNRNLKSMVQKGDMVRVTFGDLIGMQGRAVEILPNTIKVDFEGQMGLYDIHEFPSQELEKIFAVGEQIEVYNGRYAGKTGSIVSFDEKQAIFITDDTHEQLPVFLTDIRRRAIGASLNPLAKTQKMLLEKYDLVSLNEGQTVGLVLTLQSDYVTVIDLENFVSSFSQTKVDKKFLRPYVASNTRNETIQEKCVVRVLSGLNRGNNARVVKVYANKAFLYDQSRRENFGVYVESVENLQVLETPSYDDTRKKAMYNNQALLAREREEMNNSGQGLPPRPQNMRNNPQSMRISLIGQTKKIIKGVYKGYEGIIQSIIGNEVRFELSAERKVVKVPLDYLNINNAERETIANAAMSHQRTPMFRNPASATFNMYTTGTPAYKPFQ